MVEANAAQTFISYSRADATLAERLRGLLVGRGISVWIDTERIRVADDWMDRILEAIDASAAFVWLITDDSIASPVCAEEVEWALAAGKRLLPIVVGEEQEVPRSVRHLHAIRIDPSEGADLAGPVDEIARAIRADIDWAELHSRLLVGARAWEAAGRRSPAIPRPDLEAAEAALSVPRDPTEPQATDLLQAFVLAARRHRTLRFRQLVAVALAGLVALGGAIAVAVTERSDAESARAEEAVQRLAAAQERDNAAEQTQRRAAEGLAAAAVGLAEVDAEAAVQLAVGAWRLVPDDSTRFGMIRTAAALGDVVRFSPDWLGDTDFTVEFDDGLGFVAANVVHLVTDGDLGSVSTVALDASAEGIVPQVTEISSDGRHALVVWAGDDFAEEIELGVVSLETGSRLWSTPARRPERLFALDENTVLVLRRSEGLATTGELRRLSDGSVVDVSDAALFDQYAVAAFVGDGLFVSGTSGNSREELRLEVWSYGEGFVTDLQMAPDPNGEHRSFDAEGLYNVRSVDFEPESGIVVAGHSDGSITVITDEVVEGFGGHQGGIRDVAISPDGTEVVSLGDDGTLTVWSSEDARLLRSRPSPSSLNGRSVDFLTDDVLAVSTEGGVLFRSTVGATILASSSPAPAGALSPDGTMIAHLAGDMAVISPVSGGPDLAVAPLESDTQGVQIGWSGERMAVVRADADRQEIHIGSLGPGGDAIEWAAPHRVDADVRLPGTLAGSAYLVEDSGDVQVIGVPDGEPIATLDWDSIGPWLDSAAIDANGRFVAAWAAFDGGGLLRLFELDGERSDEIEIDVPGPMAWTFSSDGVTLATSDAIFGTRLFDLDAADATPTTLSDRADVFDLVFAPDGSVLVGLADAELLIWDVGTRELLAKIPTSVNMPANATAAVRTDGTIVVLDGDGLILELVQSGPDIAERLCSTAPRRLTASEWERYAGALEQADACS